MQEQSTSVVVIVLPPQQAFTRHPTSQEGRARRRKRVGVGVGVGIQPLQILRRRLSPESPAASQISSLLERPVPFPG